MRDNPNSNSNLYILYYIKVTLLLYYYSYLMKEKCGVDMQQTVCFRLLSE